jgi:hypothetical protein
MDRRQQAQAILLSVIATVLALLFGLLLVERFRSG